MEKQILTKQSTSEQIKSYFNAVLELSKSDNEYPVNLDEVWMLVYPRKDHAVRELKENFIESVDYQVFLKNGENSNGGRPCNEYHLTISCMEYFIARKVRPVFEAYRRVFHKVSKQHKMLSGAEFLLEQAKLMVEQEKRITNVERRLDAMEQEREESGRLLLKVSVSHEKLPQMSLRDKIRQLVNKYASATNTSQQDVWHKVYDQLYYLYHISIGNYKKLKRSESKLDIAERNRFLDKIYIIISNLVRERSVA